MTKKKENFLKMRLQSVCFNKIGKMLDFYSQFNPSPLSIKQFVAFGELVYNDVLDLLKQLLIVYLILFAAFIILHLNNNIENL